MNNLIEAIQSAYKDTLPRVGVDLTAAVTLVSAVIAADALTDQYCGGSNLTQEDIDNIKFRYSVLIPITVGLGYLTQKGWEEYKQQINQTELKS